MKMAKWNKSNMAVAETCLAYWGQRTLLMFPSYHNTGDDHADDDERNNTDSDANEHGRFWFARSCERNAHYSLALCKKNSIFYF